MTAWRYRLIEHRSTLLALLMFLAMFAIYVANHPAGFTANVVTTAANKGVLLALVAMAQTMVVITGGIDLSVGMVLVLANCLASYVVAGSLATALPGVLLVLLAGLACGATNGLVVVYGRLQPIVTTIATSALFCSERKTWPCTSLPPERVTDEITAVPVGPGGRPTFTDDGALMAWVGDDNNIYGARSDGANPTQLTTDGNWWSVALNNNGSLLAAEPPYALSLGIEQLDRHRRHDGDDREEHQRLELDDRRHRPGAERRELPLHPRHARFHRHGRRVLPDEAVRAAHRRQGEDRHRHRRGAGRGRSRLRRGRHAGRLRQRSRHGLPARSRCLSPSALPRHSTSGRP